MMKRIARILSFRSWWRGICIARAFRFQIWAYATKIIPRASSEKLAYFRGLHNCLIRSRMLKSRSRDRSPFLHSLTFSNRSVFCFIVSWINNDLSDHLTLPHLQKGDVHLNKLELRQLLCFFIIS
jgi:hypothetical protein